MMLALSLAVTAQQRLLDVDVVITAPIAAGNLPDVSFNEDSPISAINVAADFTGTGITYALAPSSAALPVGLSLSTSGVISGTPTAPTALRNIIVRGTNSEGFADTNFSITIAEVVTPPAGAVIIADSAQENDVTFSVASAAAGDTLEVRVDGVDYTTDYNGDPMLIDGTADQVFCLVEGNLVDDYDNSQTVTYQSAIWVSLADGQIADPVIQWRRDGVDIEGFKAITRQVPDAEAGKTLSVRETFGGVTLLSNDVAIPVKTIANDEGAIFQYIASDAVYDGSDNMVSWPDSAPDADGTLDITEAATGVTVPKRDSATGGVLLDGASGMRSGVNFRHHANLVQTPGTTVCFLYVIDVTANTPGDIQMPWAQTANGGGNYFTNNRTMIGIRNLADFHLPAYVGRFSQIINSQFNNPPNFQLDTPARAIIELHLSLEECRIYLNGSLEFTYDATNLSTSFPNTTDARNCIGGVMDAGQIGYPTTGVLHDVIATTSIDQIDNFRAELATKFGVTLQ